MSRQFVRCFVFLSREEYVETGGLRGFAGGKRGKVPFLYRRTVMSKTMVMMACAVIMVAVVPAMAQTDITNPGNAIIGIPNDNDWPGAETPPLSIDNVVTTKYLHFKGETQPTGIAVTPSGSGIVTALRLTTANDAEPRDPASYQLSGSNDPVGVPADLANINWTLISEGPLSLPSDRLTTMAAPVVFPNFTAYTHYRLMFPTVKDSANANSMQIAEIELMTAPAGGWPPSVDAGAPQLIIMPADTATMAPTVIDVDTPEEQLTYQWALRSAPAGGSVNFNGTDTQTDAQVTFSQVGGEYVLELSVTDADDNDSNDVVTIRVWDPAVDNVMVAHWDFNEGSGNVANDSTVMSTKGVNGKGEDDGELT
ncbi:MAG: hypothetical protein JW810_04590, partial [Sedimentisphaerales bacterium]|nr:hypothetical protein [Sedimentisphaerales bacterium]